MIGLSMVHTPKKQIIYICISNSIINKEYREFFPFNELAKTYEIIPIFGKAIFKEDQKFIQVKFHKFTRTIHAIIHYCIMWYRRYSSLAFKLRAYQYFGTKNEILATSNFGLYDGRRHESATTFFVRVFGNKFGISFLTKLLEFCFKIESRRKVNKVNFEKALLLLPYHGGISLEFDFLVWLSKKFNTQSIAIQQNWDNVSSKSFLFQHPTIFLTWGKQSSSHLRTIQAYTGEIKEIGSFRLNEFYREKLKLESQSDEFRSSKNVGENLKILVIGTGPGTFDYEIIKMVIKSMHDNSIKSYDITYRPHPYLVSKSGISESLKKLEGLKLNIPSSDEKNSQRVKIVLESDVIISLYSTVLLEATILNKTCIIPAFIPGPKGYSTGNFLDDFSHYSGLSSLGTINVANSSKEFFDTLTEFKSEETQIHTSEKLLNWYCKNTDTAQVLTEILKKHHDLN
jgi:hypothetical protein